MTHRLSLSLSLSPLFLANKQNVQASGDDREQHCRAGGVGVAVAAGHKPELLQLPQQLVSRAVDLTETALACKVVAQETTPCLVIAAKRCPPLKQLHKSDVVRRRTPCNPVLCLSAQHKRMHHTHTHTQYREWVSVWKCCNNANTSEKSSRRHVEQTTTFAVLCCAVLCCAVSRVLAWQGCFFEKKWMARKEKKRSQQNRTKHSGTQL